MIAVKENRQSLEQKIVELVSEYQALKIEQVEDVYKRQHLCLLVLLPIPYLWKTEIF